MCICARARQVTFELPSKRKYHIGAAYKLGILTSVEIFNEDRPGLGILGRINVQNERDDVRLGLINMHIESRPVTIQAEPVGSHRRQLHSDPCF